MDDFYGKSIKACSSHEKPKLNKKLLKYPLNLFLSINIKYYGIFQFWTSKLKCSSFNTGMWVTFLLLLIIKPNIQKLLTVILFLTWTIILNHELKTFYVLSMASIILLWWLLTIWITFQSKKTFFYLFVCMANPIRLWIMSSIINEAIKRH